MQCNAGEPPGTIALCFFFSQAKIRMNGMGSRTKSRVTTRREKRDWTKCKRPHYKFYRTLIMGIFPAHYQKSTQPNPPLPSLPSPPIPIHTYRSFNHPSGDIPNPNALPIISPT